MLAVLCMAHTTLLNISVVLIFMPSEHSEIKMTMYLMEQISTVAYGVSKPLLCKTIFGGS